MYNYGLNENFRLRGVGIVVVSDFFQSLLVQRSYFYYWKFIFCFIGNIMIELSFQFFEFWGSIFSMKKMNLFFVFVSFLVFRSFDYCKIIFDIFIFFWNINLKGDVVIRECKFFRVGLVLFFIFF